VAIIVYVAFTIIQMIIQKKYVQYADIFFREMVGEALMLIGKGIMKIFFLVKHFGSPCAKNIVVLIRQMQQVPHNTANLVILR